MSLDPKDPDVSTEYGIDWSGVLAELAKPPVMRRGVYYALNDVTCAPLDTGFDYKATRAGWTQSRMPILPRAIDATVDDGTVEWTAQSRDAAASILSVVWTLPSGLTKVSQRESGSFTYIEVSGGTDGEDYAALCRMTPSSGPALEKTILIPVRAQ